ncbi:hypothetical protein [Parapedobacter pyrenivorans]|uniref:hypothetical protein n=1 Tax=Parapedobacter pyrenivorans TaxID=1305674 RepID=UPI00333F2C1F
MDKRKLISILIVLIFSCFPAFLSAQTPEKSIFDWGTPRLIPIDVAVDKSKILVKAGGETFEFTGKLYDLEAETTLRADWSKKTDEFTTLFLSIRAETAAILQNVTWLAGQWESEAKRVVHSTNLMDNMLFLRKNDVSIFISLDFPFSQIDDSGIHYPPNASLNEGDVYHAHSLTIGACKLSGEFVGNFDKAEIEAASSYIEKRFPSRFQRPIVLSASITNQMTDVRDNRIFYSMYDNPTIGLNPELVEEDLRLNAELGIEYYQVFEGVFDWPDEEQTGKNMERLQAMAKSLGVRMGDYTVPQGLYCPHYNYLQRKFNRPDWLISGLDGGRGPECLGVQAYTDMLTDSLVAHNKKYGLQLICLDFLNIRPCYAEDHDHPVGDTYQQILGLVEMLSALNELDEDFLIWSNSGNWIDLMPKLVWYNPNVYLTDPHVREYAPHLNVLQNLGNGRREQMVSVHEHYFVPYSAFTNYEYYLAPNSRLSDTKVFEYSFLQGLAVTPNIGLGEIRSFLNRIPSQDKEHITAFVKHWLDFIGDNYEVWRHTSRLGDAPGVGAAEVYGHIKDDKGFLCLVNQNAFPVNKSLVINGSIGLSQGSAFLLTEVYPNRGPIIEQPLPSASKDDTIHFTLEPYSVRIIEVEPQRSLTYPTVYGAEPTALKKENDTYTITLTMPQGVTRDLGIVVPAGEEIVSVVASQTPTVPMFTFPVDVALVRSEANMARLRLRGPREAAPTALTRWQINQDSSWQIFPSLDLAGFLGAYIHNAFSEDYEVQLLVKSVSSSNLQKELVRNVEDDALPVRVESLPHTGIVTYTTQFVLPFIERYGQDRSNEDDAILELGFSDPDEVVFKSVRLNDEEVPVMTFKNAKNPTHITHYVELRGNAQPGMVKFQMTVEYKK